MRIKKLFGIILSLSACVSMFGCQKGVEDGKNSTIKFVTSCQPIYVIAKNLSVGIDDVEICKMSESQSGCLHNFQLQSSDMRNIEQSTAFIINGAGMEDSFLDKVLEENSSLRIVDSSRGIQLIEDECSERCHDECHDCDDCDNCDHCDCCEHCHEEFNSHIWVSPENYIVQIRNISDALKEIDKKNADKYQDNCDKYVEKIVRLKNKMHAELKSISGKNIITFHNSFRYFAREFNLNIVGVINHESGETSSAKELSEVIELVKDNNISAVFVEPQYSDVSAKMISEETGVKVCSLDPAVTGDENLDSYIEAMEKNIKILKEVL